MNSPTVVILIGCFASIALADDFKTINGKEYKNAEVSRIEPDGIVLKTKSGVAKVYFAELPKDVQQRFGHDPDKIEVEKAAEQEREKMAQKAEPTSPLEESSPAVTRQLRQASRQLDDAQFDDLRRRDWYEDLKAQEKLKNHADWIVRVIDNAKENNPSFEKCTPTFFEMLAAERKANRDNYAALSAIGAKITATKSYDDYKKLKAVEDQILGAIGVEKLEEENHVAELRLRVSELDAAMLENEQQRYR